MQIQVDRSFSSLSQASSKNLRRFRYESMEDAFIDDIDSIYDGCASLSLGYDSYFILYNDGSYNYHNLPRRLKVIY